VGNNGKDCAFKWVRKTENAVQRPKNESAFDGGIVVAVPVLSVEKLLNDSVLFLVVITEIELAGNNIILHSNHRFKEFECARMRFDFHCESLVVEMKKIVENCMNLSAGSVRVLVAISVFKFTVKIQDKRQEIIHVSDREEIRGDSPVVGLQELVKEVFVVSTVQDCKCRAQGASHCNAHNLAE